MATEQQTAYFSSPKFQDSAGEEADVRGAGQEKVLERGGHLAHPGEHQQSLPLLDLVQHQISEPHQQKVPCTWLFIWSEKIICWLEIMSCVLLQVHYTTMQLINPCWQKFFSDLMNIPVAKLHIFSPFSCVRTCYADWLWGTVFALWRMNLNYKST